MQKYLSQLREVDNDVYYNMGQASQKTIDLVQETIRQLDRDFEQKPVIKDELGAINYEIDILLDVWRVDLAFDVKTLKRVHKIISNWCHEIE